MSKNVFVFDLNMVLSPERKATLREQIAAQIESGVLLLGDEVTFVEACIASFDAAEGAPVVHIRNGAEAEPAEWAAPGAYKLTSRRSAAVGVKELKEAVKAGLVRPFDELEIVLGNGETVTAVCGGYVGEGRARFVLKDCLGEPWVMNKTATNAGGYLKSEARRHVLEDILPLFPEELREAFEPRHMTEEIDGEKHEYADTLWLPSATDVFGAGNWWKSEPDSVQLEIFKEERDRVKARADYGTCYWWLRSPSASGSYGFVFVSTDGTVDGIAACYSRGFAPGFDL